MSNFRTQRFLGTSRVTYSDVAGYIIYPGPDSIAREDVHEALAVAGCFRRGSRPICAARLTNVRMSRLNPAPLAVINTYLEEAIYFEALFFRNRFNFRTKLARVLSPSVADSPASKTRGDPVSCLFCRLPESTINGSKVFIERQSRPTHTAQTI